MKTERCQWVHDRLPLLAGGELVSDERRRVERHLIGCPGCQARRDSSHSALSALRLVASIAPTSASTSGDAPSLWPALARQIRESRHQQPVRSSWRDRLDEVRAGLASISWSAVGLALSLGGVMLAAVGSRPSGLNPSPGVVKAVEPVRSAPVAHRSIPRQPSALPESPARPLGLLSQGHGQTQPDPFQSPQGLRFEYELERGTPMEPGTRDPQHSY